MLNRLLLLQVFQLLKLKIDSMIIVKLSGGLGNQLFQYAFGRYLSLKHNTELKLDVQLDINVSNFTPRMLGLSKYKIDLNLATTEEIKKHKIFNEGYLSRFERKMIQLFPFINKNIVLEKSFIILNKELLLDDCYYEGYWQSEYYFESIKDVIKQDFQLNFDLDEANKVIADEIYKSTSISLHIRRGDYISVNSNSKIYSECSLEYYQDAINFFKLKFENSVFYIFSDDIDWAKENFKGDIFKIIDLNQDNPHADMFLMSICNHNIIANSSFSWWGAWLNGNADKIVISPKDWYRDSTVNILATSSLIPLNWIVL